MGKINLQKVIVGGLIAGLVLNVIDYVLFNMLFKEQVAAAMASIGKGATAGPTGSQITGFVVIDFATGLFLVWLYAAVRPRFGMGPGTAVKAGIAAWFFGSLLVNAFLWVAQVYPHSFLVLTTVVNLVEWPVAAVIGAKFYLEGAGMGAGMGAGAGARM